MMTTSTSAANNITSNGLVSLYRKLLDLANNLPLSIVQLLSRVAVAHVFWNSAQSKLASWPTTLQLFANEYHVPILPPDIAAPLATATELTGAVLLFFGFLSRLGALALLGVTATIQLFVYPENWGEHLVWASPLLLVVFRGPGKISLDELVDHFFSGYK
jgi:putative oxidoreductase